MKLECRKCFEKDLAGEELEQIIKDYISAIDAEYRTDHDAYKARIEKCDSCNALVNGLCAHCGCFVLARAAKKLQYCPYPGNDRWTYKQAE